MQFDSEPSFSVALTGFDAMSPHDPGRLDLMHVQNFSDKKEARLHSNTSNFLGTNAPYPWNKCVTK